jgi:hypothetical protein
MPADLMSVLRPAAVMRTLTNVTPSGYTGRRCSARYARRCAGRQPHRPPSLSSTTREQGKAMRGLGYVTAVTMAAAATMLGVMTVMSLPDIRRYLAMRRM